MPDRLHVIGPVRGSSGYDRHTREFVRSFLGHGVRVQLTPVESWSPDLPEHERESWPDELRAPVGADTVLHFTMPTHTVARPGRRNVNYTMFEADRIPAEWAGRAAEQDLVVVPTEASRRAWAAGGVDERRLRVAPLGVDAGLFSRPVPPLPLITTSGRPVGEYRSRFLNIAELRPRKNLLGLLRTWIRATRADDDAVLILKPSAYDSRALPQFLDDVALMQQALGRRLADAAPAVLLPAILPDRQMASLFRTATHYLSLSHGEGWDLVMMEAAVAGLELIAPRHTAYVEYLRDDEAHFIPSGAAPVRFEGRVGIEDAAFFDGLSWWDPDEDAAAELIRSAVEGRLPPKSPAGPRLAEEYCWQRSGRRLLEAMDATP